MDNISSGPIRPLAARPQAGQILAEYQLFSGTPFVPAPMPIERGFRIRMSSPA
jgi:hypothetical protein